MYRLFLSLRFLRHHWLMTLIGSFFVGASLVILVVVMSVMDGFQAKLKETIAGSSADLTLTPQWPFDATKLAQALEEVPGIEVAGPFHQTFTITRREGRLDAGQQKMHHAVVMGVDPRRESRINRFREYLLDLDRDAGVRTKSPFSVRDPDDPFRVHDELEAASGTVGVVVGRKLLEELGTLPNQKIRVAVAAPKDAPGDGGGPQEVELKYLLVLVVGTYESGNHDIDHSCILMDHAAFRGMFGDDVSRASVRCRLSDFGAVGAVKAEISKKLPQLMAASALPGIQIDAWPMRIRAETWREQNQTLVQAIESEKSMILVISFLIVVAGTGSIFAAQWLLVSDKVREIGILRALGAGVNGVVSIFMMNALLMGALGATIGALGGLLVVDNIDAVHGAISWILGRRVFDPDVYLFKTIPTQVDYAEVTRYALAALACTIVAGFVPALRAGLMKPAVALHRD